ncbi:glycerophosphodiester phosphodiesterase [Flavobacterium sp. 3HN19-14]|uniref:glycerophosphodiester phosphodiesterase n=1 Tax=Flavobacterium sp. 3HN19-14 TaxID=3448133 RepID=UPI003EE12BD5
MHKILKIGHRGAKGYFPENTLLSFGKAIEMNADGIELDVHLSADNEIIVIHDHTVNRTTNGNGVVKDLTLSELKAFTIDGSEKIPTLNEVFDLVDKKCLINIELKVETTAKPVTTVIEEYVSEKGWKYSHFLVSSFDWNALQEIRKWNPEIPLGVLTETDLELAIGFSEFIKAETIHPYFHLLTKENVAEMQSKGFGIFPWTVNEPEDLNRIKSFNVNGIITDFPDKI